MGTCDLPEMYACSPWAAPLDFGHTFLTNYSCSCYNYKMPGYIRNVAGLQPDSDYIDVDAEINCGDRIILT